MTDNNYIRTIAIRIRREFSADELPKEGLDYLFDIYALLALSKGTAVTIEDVHNAWSTWATAYDPSNKSLAPFDKLTDEVKQLDEPFRAVISKVAESLEA